MGVGSKFLSDYVAEEVEKTKHEGKSSKRASGKARKLPKAIKKMTKDDYLNWDAENRRE